MNHARIHPSHPDHPANRKTFEVSQQAHDLVSELESACMDLQAADANDVGLVAALYAKVQDRREMLYRHIAACESNSVHLVGEPKTPLKF